EAAEAAERPAVVAQADEGQRPGPPQADAGQRHDAAVLAEALPPPPTAGGPRRTPSSVPHNPAAAGSSHAPAHSARVLSSAPDAGGRLQKAPPERLKVHSRVVARFVPAIIGLMLQEGQEPCSYCTTPATTPTTSGSAVKSSTGWT